MLRRIGEALFRLGFEHRGSDAPYSIDTSFPKGMAYADWLVNVGASATRGSIDLTSVESPAMSLTPGFGSQSWVVDDGGIPYFSVPMPVEKAATPADQCGRFVHTGIHVTPSGNGGPFPSSAARRADVAARRGGAAAATATPTAAAADHPLASLRVRESGQRSRHRSRPGPLLIFRWREDNFVGDLSR